MNKYKQKLEGKELEKAAYWTKKIFIENLENELNIFKANSPIFLDSNKGLNDRLSGIEKPVYFNTRNAKLEIIHSLAKWKREEIARLNCSDYEGIWTNMKAIRAEEEEETPFHSIFVEQFDWEKKITKKDRNLTYLKQEVEKIYNALLKTEEEINKKFPLLENKLPKKISFITSEELLKMYPNKTEKERENAFGKEKGAYFLIGIGHKLSNGKSHDKRAPDYDDWNLNGDILLYSKIHNKVIEISSMGIRVDKNSLLLQIEKSKNKEHFQYEYHEKIKEEKLPFTIGGGIGQSRIVLFFLELFHIGEFQFSYWTDKHREEMKKNGVKLK